MVMETPSPQSVGREFVRQYYTLLHEAPLHLHRFYSHDSSFVHGGVEKPGEEQPPVMGQQDIHKKIMSLNFRDCHAKIRQVDSQATVGSAVVVQVTGELSNNGQPMRRFMQTFVLAPQSPKKYYVHNDIFRYQDEVFHDNDSDTENQEEAVDSEQENLETSSQPDAIQDPPVATFYDPNPPATTMSNGNAHMEERVETPPPTLKPPMNIADDKEEEEPVLSEHTYDATPVAPIKVEEPEPEPEPQTVVPEAPKTFSWAAITSKTPGAPAPQTTGPTPAVVKVQSTKPDTIKPDNSSNPQPQRAPRPPRERTGGFGGRERGREGRGEDSEDGGRRSRFPDSQQLFVGNLPHNVTEKELKEFFEEYGSVVELRINTKGTGKNVPNFGFVVFGSSEPVLRILNEKKIMFQNHRLNVEEKKQRSEGGRPGSGTRNNSRGGPPGPGRGGPGGMRGGRGGMGGPGRGGDNRAMSAGPGGGGRGGFPGPRR